METSVGTANNGDRVLVGDGEGVGQTTASVGDGLALSSLDLFTIKNITDGSGGGGGSSDDHGQEIQTDLADILGAFAHASPAASSLNSGSGAFKISAVLSYGGTAAHGN